MSSTAISTLTQMMETLPEPVQNQAVEHLRQFIADLQDEMAWDASFKQTQSGLIAAAQQARKQIADGHAQPMDYKRL